MAEVGIGNVVRNGEDWALFADPTHLRREPSAR